MNEGSNLENVVKEILPLVTGPRVLDVGTGFGTVISNLLPENFEEIVSIDPEKWTFDRIQETYRNEIASGRLVLKESGVEDIPYRDNYFNSVLAICSIHHVTETEKAIREMERVCSGRIIITDWNPSIARSGFPHSPEHLRNSRERVLAYTEKMHYNIQDQETWYIAWK